jgi:hypothetical protein
MLFVFPPPPPPGIIGGNPLFKSRFLPFGQEKTTNSDKNALLEHKTVSNSQKSNLETSGFNQMVSAVIP